MAFNNSTMLEKTDIYGTSIHRGYFSAAREFTKTRTTMLGKERPFLSEEPQRLINNDSTIETENFES